MFIKETLKTQEKLKDLEIMYSLSVFLNNAKFADFQWKNADFSRNQGVCHVIHIVFGSSLDKV